MNKVESYRFTGYSDEKIESLLPNDRAVYKNDYLKECYDIKLKDGTIIYNCYPNAGKFMSFNNQGTHDGKDISLFRLAANPFF